MCLDVCLLCDVCVVIVLLFGCVNWFCYCMFDCVLRCVVCVSVFACLLLLHMLFCFELFACMLL